MNKHRSLSALSLLLCCASANAQSTTATPAQHLDTITVEAARQREAVERQVNAFLGQIAVKPYDSSLARWEPVVPICPLVAGLRATATRITFNQTRDLTSALIMVDGPRARGINFGQLAAYIAMLGLAEIRANADVADGPSILHLFSRSENERPSGLSAWDEAFLKALYRTEHTDRQQLAEIKTAMVQEIAP